MISLKFYNFKKFIGFFNVMKHKFKNEFDIGTRIKERREHLNLSRNVVCELLGGISLTTLTLWEKNEREPQASVLIKLADILETTPSYLLTGENKTVGSLNVKQQSLNVEEALQALKNALIAEQKLEKQTEQGIVLNKQEKELVDWFKQCNEDRKVMILSSAKGLAEQTQKEQKESSESLKNCEVA
ncbi:helix-turn-helix domain-containing protein [Pasteurella multocida]|uniref:helix-turn-helix domain-containing protein n=1 Tax=Pasteurella multocida TaxID=747 RepID=UPI0020236C22|nr:helix-turn-helix transcriptional regulator [Pasteurella multocida]URH93226.1 helix-turn-helix domain-containing protein [Pasteurella multocida]URH99599.1 helix-turn-helix domain-containing protein [Pasteurella multocida]